MLVKGGHIPERFLLEKMQEFFSLASGFSNAFGFYQAGIDIDDIIVVVKFRNILQILPSLYLKVQIVSAFAALPGILKSYYLFSEVSINLP